MTCPSGLEERGAEMKGVNVLIKLNVMTQRPSVSGWRWGDVFSLAILFIPSFTATLV